MLVLVVHQWSSPRCQFLPSSSISHVYIYIRYNRSPNLPQISKVLKRKVAATSKGNWTRKSHAQVCWPLVKLDSKAQKYLYWKEWKMVSLRSLLAKEHNATIFRFCQQRSLFCSLHKLPNDQQKQLMIGRSVPSVPPHLPSTVYHNRITAFKLSSTAHSVDLYNPSATIFMYY